MDEVKLFSEREPMSWSTGMQISLNIARGLEYINSSQQEIKSYFTKCKLQWEQIVVVQCLNVL